MLNYQQNKLFANLFFTFLSTILIILLFFKLTGNKYLDVDLNYVKGICIPKLNAWSVWQCTWIEYGVDPEMAIKECYYDQHCNIVFNKPMLYPKWLPVLLYFLGSVLLIFCPLSPVAKILKKE